MPPGERTFQRLDRRVAHATGLSRARAQRAIRAGEIHVDGQPVTDPGAPVADDARIEHAGEVLAGGHRYYMLHKPAGVVCATRDREHRTVLDLLAVPNKSGLHIAGRLDIDATGLVLISDDGDWSHAITSPRRKLPKTYRVQLAEPLAEAAAEQLRRGVALRGEPKACAPATVERLSGNEVRLTISEGKYHQVKRMFAAVGNQVQQLHRERIGAIVLDPRLAPGDMRVLTAGEIAAAGR
jgi:16S rRNA pseudouridine516 synthase